MQKTTKPTKISEISHSWHLVDVQGKTLGRIASQIAQLLMGKAKPHFVRNLDCGDYVVAINVSGIKITGNKAQQKIYYRHSGYPGGMRQETYAEIKERRPEFVLEHAVKGMLPQNRLRDSMLKRLKIFVDEKHTYNDKVKTIDDRK